MANADKYQRKIFNDCILNQNKWRGLKASNHQVLKLMSRNGVVNNIFNVFVYVQDAENRADDATHKKQLERL